jgi:hypothetical protein
MHHGATVPSSPRRPAVRSGFGEQSPELFSWNNFKERIVSEEGSRKPVSRTMRTLSLFASTATHGSFFKR